MAQLLQRLSNGLNEIVKVICVIIAIVLTVTIFVGVISRYILGKPFIWEYGFSIMLLVWMTFLSVSIGFKEGAHLALTFLLDRLPPSPRQSCSGARFCGNNPLRHLLHRERLWHCAVVPAEDLSDHPCIAGLDLCCPAYMFCRDCHPLDRSCSRDRGSAVGRASPSR